MLGNLGSRMQPPSSTRLILGMQQGCFHTSAMRDLSRLHLDDAVAPKPPPEAEAPKKRGRTTCRGRERTMCRGWRRRCRKGRKGTGVPVEKNRVTVRGGVSFFICFDGEGTDQESEGEEEEEVEAATRERTVSVGSDDSFIVFERDGAEPESDDFEDESDSQSEESETEQYSSLDSVVPRKRVRFASPSRLCKVRTMKLWVLAHRKIRMPYWLHVANDRVRFRDRISRMESVISPVLSPAHRSKIFEERFSENE